MWLFTEKIEGSQMEEANASTKPSGTLKKQMLGNSGPGRDYNWRQWWSFGPKWLNAEMMWRNSEIAMPVEFVREIVED